jgi:hypothetical protein
MSFTLETAPYLTPLLAFAHSYGMMVLGAFLVLVALTGRKFGPLAIFPLVIGLGIVLSGVARFLPR